MKLKKSLLVLSLCLTPLALTSCNFNFVTQEESEFLKQTKEIYELAKEAGFKGTYDERISSIEGEAGKSGIGITNIIFVGEVDGNLTYETIFNDGSTYEFKIKTIKDGKSVMDIKLVESNGLIDTYTISYSDETKSEFYIVNGSDGEQGIQGTPGEDGHTPLIEIKDGNWVIDGKDTLIEVTGLKGETGEDGANGLSAYEIYIKTHEGSKEKYPTEKEWIDALINGEIIDKTKYNVTYVSNDEVLEIVKVSKGDKVTKPNNPTREGYTFDGWYYQDEKWSFIGYQVNEDITLVAHWIPNVYKVNFEIMPNNVKVIDVTFDSNITLFTPTRDGYTFLGWYYEDALFKNDSKMIFPHDITLVAHWSANKYTVNYHLGYNELTHIEEYYFDADISIYIPEDRENYSFSYWYYLDENSAQVKLNDGKYNISKNLDVYAKWNYQINKIKINNKEELESDWFINEGSRNINLIVEPIDSTITADALFNNKDLIISSSNPDILKIDNAKLTPIAIGSTTLSISSSSNPNIKDEVKIKVFGEDVYNNLIPLNEVYTKKLGDKIKTHAIYVGGALNPKYGLYFGDGDLGINVYGQTECLKGVHPGDECVIEGTLDVYSGLYLITKAQIIKVRRTLSSNPITIENLDLETMKPIDLMNRKVKVSGTIKEFKIGNFNTFTFKLLTEKNQLVNIRADERYVDISEISQLKNDDVITLEGYGSYFINRMDTMPIDNNGFQVVLPRLIK